MGTAIGRRAFLGRVLAFGALGSAGYASTSSGGGAGRLPGQGEYLIRNGFVMTMEPGAAADLAEGLGTGARRAHPGGRASIERQAPRPSTRGE